MERIELLLAYLKETPEDPFLHFALAQEYGNRHQLKEALQVYEYLMENHPDYVGTYYHAGQAYEAAERLERAMECYDVGIKVAKQARDTHSASELESVKTQLEDRI